MRLEVASGRSLDAVEWTGEAFVPPSTMTIERVRRRSLYLIYFDATCAHFARVLRKGYACLGASISPVKEVLKGTMRP